MNPCPLVTTPMVMERLHRGVGGLSCQLHSYLSAYARPIPLWQLYNHNAKVRHSAADQLQLSYLVHIKTLQHVYEDKKLQAEHHECLWWSRRSWSPYLFIPDELWNTKLESC